MSGISYNNSTTLFSYTVHIHVCFSFITRIANSKMIVSVTCFLKEGHINLSITLGMTKTRYMTQAESAFTIEMINHISMPLVIHMLKTHITFDYRTQFDPKSTYTCPNAKFQQLAIDCWQKKKTVTYSVTITGWCTN